MKLTNTRQYLILVDENNEIKKGDYGQLVARPDMIWKFDDKKIDVYKNDGVGANKIVAYYPLAKDVKELDLPLLPEFHKEANIKNIALSLYKEPLNKEGEKRTKLVGSYGNPYGFNKWFKAFKVGYKTAQSKQFSLEDIESAMKMALAYGFALRSTSLRTHSEVESEFYKTEQNNKIIRSLVTQQLPKEFIPEYEKEHDDTVSFPKMRDSEMVKVRKNSEGKKELIGTYKY